MQKRINYIFSKMKILSLLFCFAFISVADASGMDQLLIYTSLKLFGESEYYDFKYSDKDEIEEIYSDFFWSKFKIYYLFIPDSIVLGYTNFSLDKNKTKDLPCRGDELKTEMISLIGNNIIDIYNFYKDKDYICSWVIDDFFHVLKKSPRFDLYNEYIQKKAGLKFNEINDVLKIKTREKFVDENYFLKSYIDLLNCITKALNRENIDCGYLYYDLMRTLFSYWICIDNEIIRESLQFEKNVNGCSIIYDKDIRGKCLNELKRGNVKYELLDDSTYLLRTILYYLPSSYCKSTDAMFENFEKWLNEKVVLKEKRKETIRKEG